MPALQPQFSMKSDVRSGYGRPVLVSITQVWLTISGWMSQLGVIKRAHQLEAGVELLLRPAGQVAVEPAHAGGVWDQAVLSLDAALGAPLAESSHERVGNLARQGLPGLVILVRKDLVELRNAEVGQVDQAGRVVNDQADGHAAAGVDDGNARGGFRWACTRFLAHGRFGSTTTSRRTARSSRLPDQPRSFARSGDGSPATCPTSARRS